MNSTSHRFQISSMANRMETYDTKTEAEVRCQCKQRKTRSNFLFKINCQFFCIRIITLITSLRTVFIFFHVIVNFIT